MDDDSCGDASTPPLKIAVCETDGETSQSEGEDSPPAAAGEPAAKKKARACVLWREPVFLRPPPFHQKKRGKASKKSSAEDERFASSLAELRGGALWVAVHDVSVARLPVLLAELRAHGASVTALDLSGNALGDAGCAALVAALQEGAAPDLISIDLSSNNVGDPGKAAIASLRRVRKKIEVALEPPPPPSAAVPKRASPPRMSRSQRAAGGLASRLFGSPAEEGGGGASPPQQHRSPPVQPPPGGAPASPPRASPLDCAQAAVRAVSSVLASSSSSQLSSSPSPSFCPSSLGAALFAAADGVDAEMAAAADSRGYGGASPSSGASSSGPGSGAFSAPSPPSGAPPHPPLPSPPPPMFASVSSLPPASRALAAAVIALVRILSVPPQPLPWQGGATPAELRTGCGTHRLAALLLLLRLVHIGCEELDGELGAAGAAPAAARLLFSCPCSSPCASAAVALLTAAVRSPVEALWASVIDSPPPQPLHPQPRSHPHSHAPPSDGGGDGDDACSRLPLTARIAAAVAAGARVSPGRRAPHVGALVALANGLHAASSDGGGGAKLGERLRDDAPWQAFLSGPLASINAEQACVLCGPKPAKPALGLGGGGELMGLTSGGGGAFSGLLSGRELLSMLSQFSRLSHSSS